MMRRLFGGLRMHCSVRPGHRAYEDHVGFTEKPGFVTK